MLKELKVLMILNMFQVERTSEDKRQVESLQFWREGIETATRPSQGEELKLLLVYHKGNVRKIVEIIIENTIEFAPELAVVGASLDLQEGVLIVNKICTDLD